MGFWSLRTRSCSTRLMSSAHNSVTYGALRRGRAMQEPGRPSPTCERLLKPVLHNLASGGDAVAQQRCTTWRVVEIPWLNLSGLPA